MLESSEQHLPFPIETDLEPLARIAFEKGYGERDQLRESLMILLTATRQYLLILQESPEIRCRLADVVSEEQQYILLMAMWYVQASDGWEK